MNIGRVCLGFFALVVVAALAIVGWDVAQLGREAPELVPIEARATSLVVDKAARRLSLFQNDRILKVYDVSLGAAPTGHKQQEGDGRTPEGTYAIDFKNARSRFHLALRVSYPNARDRASARQRGVPPGGDIMIHGLPNGLSWLGGLHLRRDWTDGCIAVTNPQMEEIWTLVDVGTSIEIKP